MNNQSLNTQQPQSSRFMVKFGIVIVIGVAIYFLFMAIDGIGLKHQTGTAMVIGKTYRESGKTYRTQKIGNRTLTIPQHTPEMYILQLTIGGKQTECAVDKSLYDAVQREDEVNVIYQKRRIMGHLQVIDVTL